MMGYILICMDYIYVIDGVDFILYTGLWAEPFSSTSRKWRGTPAWKMGFEAILSNGKLSGRHSGFDLLDMAGNRQQHWCPEKLINT